jgi:asparagine synthase (glutamine-hydrolysing)
MCGIAGVVGPSAQLADVDRMLDRTRHRGPDGRGVWSRPGIALGHLRLSIIDLSSGGAQPMIAADGRHTLVFNGEIYNYRELRAEIGDRYPFRTQSDTEVLLAAHVLWGEAAPQRLRGMFAYAVCDGSSVLLARDRLGIKPLYWTSVGDAVAFCSEIKGLLSVGQSPPLIDGTRVHAYLAHRQLDAGNGTLFAGIQAVEAGTMVRIALDGRRAAPRRYWTFPDFGDAPFGAPEIAQLREQLNETVALHLRSDVPIGFFVSGGVDSSSVACLARQSLGPDYAMHLFSAVETPDIRNEENRLIPLVQDAVRGQVHEFLLDGRGFLDDLPKVIEHHDEPLLDGSMYSHFALCRMARAAGLKVLLSGSGGDELFAGYSSHVTGLLASLLQQGRVIDWWRRCGRLAPQGSRWGLAVRSAQELAPVGLREHYKQRHAARLLDGLLATSQAEERFFRVKERDPFRSVFVANYRHWTVPPYLHYEDRNSMAFGLEARVPFYDHKLIEFVCRHRPEDFVQAQSKHLLREAVASVVPREVVYQKRKFGFAGAIGKLLRELDFVDQARAAQLARKFFARQTSELESGLFWRLLCLGIWRQKFFHADS